MIRAVWTNENNEQFTRFIVLIVLNECRGPAVAEVLCRGVLWIGLLKLSNINFKIYTHSLYTQYTAAATFPASSAIEHLNRHPTVFHKSAQIMWNFHFPPFKKH